MSKENSHEILSFDTAKGSDKSCRVTGHVEHGVLIIDSVEFNLDTPNPEEKK